eukprot:4830367-Amphidinium_carterae.1
MLDDETSLERAGIAVQASSRASLYREHDEVTFQVEVQDAYTQHCIRFANALTTAISTSMMVWSFGLPGMFLRLLTEDLHQRRAELSRIRDIVSAFAAAARS